MSFGLGEATYELEDACCEATRRGIAMLCSAHVEGINLTHAYPAGLFGTIPIIACDESGMTPPGNKNLGNEFAVNVPAEIVPVLNSNENISESSVATAIAAGISSLRGVTCKKWLEMSQILSNLKDLLELTAMSMERGI